MDMQELNSEWKEILNEIEEYNYLEGEHLETLKDDIFCDLEVYEALLEADFDTCSDAISTMIGMMIAGEAYYHFETFAEFIKQNNLMEDDTLGETCETLITQIINAEDCDEAQSIIYFVNNVLKNDELADSMKQKIEDNC
ncbi:hypothetical protein [Thiomicrorhabdus sp. Milos-T2]|uniref:hypothetical protein n=1 Tax=Thiomicrorhabdus sp. Milos-T2 TaxID=90814 RepID=UPI000494181A|nr:hypothetical protein [Thiomicrorhabdus sp. Milos-T2]